MVDEDERYTEIKDYEIWLLPCEDGLCSDEQIANPILGDKKIDRVLNSESYRIRVLFRTRHPDETFKISNFRLKYIK